MLVTMIPPIRNAVDNGTVDNGTVDNGDDFMVIIVVLLTVT